MTPEARARIKIDAMLAAAGWVLQSRDELNLHAGPGVAVLEAKPEGVTLLGTGP